MNAIIQLRSEGATHCRLSPAHHRSLHILQYLNDSGVLVLFNRAASIELAHPHLLITSIYDLTQLSGHVPLVLTNQIFIS